jgi:Spy/CpxP family protein refolding chaperone
MRPGWRPTLSALILGLALGAAAGSWGQRAASRRPVKNDQKHREQMLDKMSRALGLDDKQKAAVSVVMNSRMADVDKLKAETFARLEAIRTSADAEMVKVLTPDQAAKLTAMHRGKPLRINWDGPPAAAP